MHNSHRQSTLILTLIHFLSLAIFSLAEGDAVTCGSAVKLSHEVTGYFLQSEEKSLKGSSGQQFVSFVKDPSSTNSLWWVRPQHHSTEGEYPDDASCQLGESIKCGSLLRFTHLGTKKNLHSHNFKSALSGQQEVSAYGKGDGKGDGGDNWFLECSTKYWKRDQPVRLHHRDTGRYLGSSMKTEFNADTCGRNCPIMGHLEAFGRTESDKFTLVTARQGIFLSK